jgi:hypothetical protein
MMTIFKNISIGIIFLLVCSAGGCRQNYQSKMSKPFYGMSRKEFNELCGSTDHVVFEENIDGCRIIYIYEEDTNYPNCRGKFIFETDDSLISMPKEK